MFLVYINRKSGTAHLARDCEAIVNVPDGALRVVEAHNAGHARVCGYCYSANVRRGWLVETCSDSGQHS